MKLLREISDTDIGGKMDPAMKYRLRKAVRLFLTRESDGKVALLYNGVGEYHKFPGGGIDEGEDIEKAIVREIYEEVGCECEVGDDVGMIVEYRKEFEQVQLSYCCMASTNATIFESHFTEKELSEGFELRRYDKNELKSVIASDIPKTDEGKFIQIRAAEIIEAVL